MSVNQSPRRGILAFRILVTSVAMASLCAAASIDREALVKRHNPHFTRVEPQSPLQVGNGEFAFSADVTGLQTFPEAYPTTGLGTLSQWGWHSFPIPPGLKREDLRLTPWETHGRDVGYATSSKGQEPLYFWMRENPHRLHLGRIGLEILKSDGTRAAIGDLKKIDQQLDLWTGLLTSRFEVEGQPVEVQTSVHPARDAMAARVVSPLLAGKRLRVVISYPYGSPKMPAGDWDKPEAHQTTLARTSANRADFTRKLDADAYAVSLTWGTGAELKDVSPHTFALCAGDGASDLEFVCSFSAAANPEPLPSVAQVRQSAADHWKLFWTTGGAIDLSASKDPRWKELERRIVLSQYLMAVNAAGSLPPQESGLVNNGWNGKFHLEMHWWHGAHFALWGRWPLLEKSLGFYRRILPQARQLAQSQGYKGARWPKMVGPDGLDSPSGVGPLLIWQQPHPIWYAAMDYRLHPTPETLEKWRDVVLETGDFLASFASLDKSTGQYVLGPPIKTVPENTDPKTTRNPAFELSYWRFGLKTAQAWRQRLGLPRNVNCDDVLNKLAPLPVQDGVYLQQEGMSDTYTKWNWEHPGLIGVYGMLPGDGADPQIAARTVEKVMATWQWEKKSWGWDFPMLAMAAARTGQPSRAIDALLMNVGRNQFTANGLSTGGPYPYFPSNGGLLYAAAMMAAGWDGAPATHAPGFPSDGSWTVRWEGLTPAP